MTREVTDEMIAAYQAARAALNQEQMHGRPPASEGAKVQAGLAAVLALLDAEDVPAENDDPTKINLIGRTIERCEITIDRAVYEAAKADDMLEDELDVYLSDMDGDTVVIEPDGTVVNPYA